MRTAYFLCAGLLLMSAVTILGRLLAAEVPAARTWILLIGIAAWLAATGFNFWVGVSHAGYTVKEELPILVGLFLAPVILAVLARRWWG